MPLYFASVEGRTEVKIGFASNLRERLRAFQSYHPSGVTFFRTFVGSMADEKALHQRFGHLRLVGEWFAWNDAFNGDVGLPDLGSLGPFAISTINKPPRSAASLALTAESARQAWATRRAASAQPVAA